MAAVHLVDTVVVAVADQNSCDALENYCLACAVAASVGRENRSAHYSNESVDRVHGTLEFVVAAVAADAAAVAVAVDVAVHRTTFDRIAADSCPVRNSNSPDDENPSVGYSFD